MKKVECLLTRKFIDGDIDYIKSKLHSKIKLIIPQNFSEQSLSNVLREKNIEIILGTIPSEDFIDQASHLRLIQIPWNGVDNTKIPKGISKEITICNSHSNAAYTAELAVALMLSLLKWIPLHDASLRQNNWRRPNGNNKFYAPEVIRGKKVGILGFGRIGYTISKLLQGFDVKISAISMSGKDKYSSGIHIKNTSHLPEFYEKNDVIFVSIPLTPKTTNLIGASEFNRMKNSTYLINVSRGAIIEEEPFYNALKNKAIAGAAIDVWYQYPQRGNSEVSPSNYPFNELDNVVLSPHRGGFAKDLLPHLDEVIENLNNYAEGKPLINSINIKEEY